MSGSSEDAGSLPTYAWDEIAQHNTPESLWVVMEGQVYDITQFQEEVYICCTYKSSVESRRAWERREGGSLIFLEYRDKRPAFFVIVC